MPSTTARRLRVSREGFRSVLPSPRVTDAQRATVARLVDGLIAQANSDGALVLPLSVRFASPGTSPGDHGAIVLSQWGGIVAFVWPTGATT